MFGRFSRRVLMALLAVTLVAGSVRAGEIYSTMRNVNAVPEAHGFSLSPVFDVDVPRRDGDLAPAQAFEILRADDRPVTIGRLFTSCVCIQLEAHKRTFRPGERAILQLRNVKPTPANGQIYAIFVQITSPIRATLRFDTFVQSGFPGQTTAGSVATGDGAAMNPSDPTPIPLPGNDQRQSAVVIINEEPPTPPSQSGTAAFLTDTATPAAEEGAASGTASETPQGAVEATGAFLAELPAMTAEPAVRMVEEDLPATVEAAETTAATIADQAQASIDSLQSAADAVAAAVIAIPAEIVGNAVPGSSEAPGAPAAPEMPADLGMGGFGDDLPDFNAAMPSSPVIPAQPVAIMEAEIPTTVPTPAPAAEPVPAAPVVVDILTPVPTEYDLPGLDPTLTGSAQVAAATGQPVPVPPPSRDPNARRPVQAVSLITIGVRDMAASIRFYEALGWQRAARGKYDQTAFFQLQGQILALYPLQDQLREANMPAATPSPGGITLALHVSDKADVWSVYQRFIDAGGSSLRPPAEMASGAVSSYVADPDGNPWEISWVPQFRIDADGGLWLP